MTPEGKIEAYLVKRVRETGGESRKLRWIARNGAPDRLVWWKGPILAFIEVKAPGGRLAKAQWLEHERLQDAGFVVRVVWSKEDVDAVIQGLTQPTGCVS